MPIWTARELATAVLTTMQDVLVHQRGRWANLLAHQHQVEGWWKAEFALALESWCWRQDHPEPVWVFSEVKPRDHGIGTGRDSVDLMVARWSESERRVQREPPRIWIEIKERGTWWGSPAKAFGDANAGLRSDLAKWREANWLPGDTVLACQIIAHDADANASCHLPENWSTALNTIAEEFPRYVPTRSVCCPVVNPAGDSIMHRFATMEFFTIFGS